MISRISARRSMSSLITYATNWCAWAVVSAGVFFEHEPQVHQEEMRQKRLGHMVMPAAPTARLIMVHPDFAFAFFQGGLHWPTQTTQLRQFIVCTSERCITQVKLQLWLRLQPTTQHC